MAHVDSSEVVKLCESLGCVHANPCGCGLFAFAHVAWSITLH